MKKENFESIEAVTHTHTHTHGYSNRKGITLLALIITIIVMLILAGVSISMLIGEDGIITKARQSSEEYQKKAKIEKVLMEIEFNENTAGERMKGKTAEELAKVIVENDLEIDNLHVYYDKSTETERITYKYDKITNAEERRKIESLGVKVLRGDANKDGMVNEIDVAFLRDISVDNTIYDDEYLIRTCDFNVTGSVNEYDGNVLYLLTSGRYSIDFYDELYDERNSEEYNSRKIIRYQKVLPGIEFVEFYDEHSKTSHVVYMYNEGITSSDEYTLSSFDEFKVGNTYIGVKMLKGDANLDGAFTQEDIDLIKNYLENKLSNEEKIEFEKELATRTKIVDMNDNNIIEEADILKLTNVLNGTEPMYKEWEQ